MSKYPKSLLFLSFNKAYWSKDFLNITLMAILPVIVFFLPHSSLAIDSLAIDGKLLTDFRKKNIALTVVPKPLKEISKQINSSTSKKDVQAAKKNLLPHLKSLGRGYHDEIWFLNGILEEKSGDFKEARTSYINSLKRKANQTSSLVRLGVVQAELNNHQSAIELLNEARWRLEDNNLEILSLLAKVFNDINKPDKAEKLLEKASVINGGSTENLTLVLDTKLKKLENTKDLKKRSDLKANISVALDNLVNQGIDSERIIDLYAQYTLELSDPLIDAKKFQSLEDLLMTHSKKRSFKNEGTVIHLINCQILRQNFNGAKNTLSIAKKALPGSAKLIEIEKQLLIETGGI